MSHHRRQVRQVAVFSVRSILRFSVRSNLCPRRRPTTMGPSWRSIILSTRRSVQSLPNLSNGRPLPRPGASTEAIACEVVQQAECSGQLVSGSMINRALEQLRARFAVDAGELVASLVDAGVVTTSERRRTRCASIRIHGRGPLSDLLAGGLRCSGARVTRSSITHTAPPDTTDLVVLADFLVADPWVVRELHSCGIAHLPVRLRDGAGLVGPLVVPGVTSCLSWS